MEERHENFIAAERKREMLAATKVKMSGSEKKVSEAHLVHTLGSFWKFHVVVVQNNGKEMYQKSVLHVPSCFLLIRPTDILPFSLPSPLSITRFDILFE